MGDLNKDGNLDAFVTNNDSGHPNEVWLNDGSGTFTDSTQRLGSSNSKDAALGDLDGDGDLDAFVVNSDSQANRVWINNGSGTFIDSTQELGNLSSQSVALGDLNGDGNLDAFIANSAENKVWLNDGAGNFTESTQDLGSSNSTGVALGDLDNDGDLDAFVSNSTSQGNKVWINEGTGTFSDSNQSLGDSNSSGISLGDLNNDGNLDAFVVNWDQANKVWINDGSGAFSASTQNLGNKKSTEVALGDLDNDGNLDAYVSNHLNQANEVWINNGSGTFSESQTNNEAESLDADMGDLDGDGDLDVFVGNYGGQANKVWLNAFDDTAPSDPTSLDSSSHTVSQESSDNTVDVTWSGDAADNQGGSGLAGFSTLWDTNADTTPDDTVDHASGVTIETSAALANGNSHYFHLRTCDNAGNCTSTKHLGPFVILAPEPEMNVLGNGQSIPNGYDSPSETNETDFGTIQVHGGTDTHTFFIENTGDAELSLSGSPYAVTIPTTNGCTSSSDMTVSTQPSITSLANSESTSFEITFDPSGSGLCQATVSIDNNDSDENPYTFTIQGTGQLNTYTISGYVKDAGDQAIENVTMSGFPGSPTTDINGQYTATVEHGWSGTVTPQKTNYVFVPVNRTYSNITANQADEDYTAGINCYSLTATANPSGGGSISANPTPNCASGTKYLPGTSVSLTASPASSYYRFKDWSEDASGSTNPVQISMTADKSVNGNFEQSTFADVPFDHQHYTYIEALWDGGYTAGCQTDPSLLYCPDTVLNRAMSAVFMLRGHKGTGYSPPASPWDSFADDWSGSDIAWSEKWAEGMWEEGLTAGCQTPGDPLLYCPRRELPRVEASVFGLRMMHGVAYVPPAATGTLLADMTDTGYWGAKWAEQAFRDGLLPDCGIQNGKPLYCPDQLVDRAWAAYLIAVAKNLAIDYPLTQPVLSYPGDGDLLTNSLPTLEWQEVAGATWYNIQVAGTGKLDTTDLEENEWVLASAACTGGSCTWQVDEALANGSYDWRVRARNVEAHFSPWSSVWDFTISACYTLTTTSNPAEGGSISANPSPNCENGTRYTLGTQVSLTATPNTGYQFVDWAGDAAGSDTPTTITMDGNKSVAANFRSGEYQTVEFCGVVDSDTNWLTHTTYRITCNSSVASGTTLTIPGDVIVKFNPNTHIVVDGSLNVNGTSANIVHFTTVLDDSIGGDTNGDGTATTPAPGDWRYIYIRGTANLEYASFQYGGYDSYPMIDVRGGSLTATNSNFENSKNNGIYVNDGLLSISNSSISNNGNDGLEYNADDPAKAFTLLNNVFNNNGGYPISFTLSDNGENIFFDTSTFSGNSGTNNAQNAIWFRVNISGTSELAPQGNLVNVFSQVTINDGSSLTILPGAIVKFPAGSRFYIIGALHSQGSESEPIHFTSLKDDSVGGDTNGDGSTTSPSQSDWESIQVYSGGVATFDYSNISYGNWTLFLQNAASVTLNTSNIEHNKYGAFVTSDILDQLAKIEFNASKLSNNDIGIYASYDVGTFEVSVNGSQINFNSTGMEIFKKHTSSTSPQSLVDINDSTFDNNDSSGIALSGEIETNISGSTISNNWLGIDGYANNTSIINCVFDNNNTGINSGIGEGGEFEISGNEFINNSLPAHIMIGKGKLITTTPNFGNNNEYGMISITGTIGDGTILTPNTNLPYYVGLDHIIIESGSTLTLGEGVIIKLSGEFTNYAYSKIDVQGTLLSQGTESNPVYITSFKDDSVGGDTNGDLYGTTPERGDWGYIDLNSGGNATLNYTKIRYGGDAEGSITISGESQATLNHTEISNSIDDGVYLKGTNSQITLNASVLENNDSYGIGTSSNGNHSITITESSLINNGGGIHASGESTISIIGSNIYGNNTGIRLDDQHNVTITSNNIYNNSSYGIYNSEYSIIPNAENNWWGDPSGPAPYGSGNKINYRKVYDSDCDCQIIDQFYVDADPWLGQATNYGQSVAWNAYEADPVNTATGNYAYQRTDLSIPTRSLPLEFSRSYNSVAPVDDILGFGWTHSYNINAAENSSDSSVTILHGDGRTERFTWNDSSSAYDPPAGTFSTLEKVGDNFRLTLKDQTVYDFNSSGNLSTITDRNGNVTTLSYSGSLLSNIAAPDGRTLTFSYNGDYRLSQVSDPLARTVQFTYDGNGNLTTVTDPTSAATTYTYNNDHRLLTTTDANSHTFVSNTYNGDGRVSQQQDGAGNITTFVYDIENHKTIVTDPRGNTRTYQYDSSLRLTSQIDGLGNTESFTYDGDNNRSSFTDKRGNTTNFTYDDRGNALTITNPLSGVTSYTYNSKNNPLTFTDANSHTTTQTYDSKGNRTMSANPLSGITLYAYHGTGNRNGLLASQTDPLGRTTNYDYNAQGDLVSITDPLSGVVTYTYDAGGRQLSMTDARSNTTTFTYDSLNRLLTETNALGGITTYTYDSVGNLASITDPKGGTTTYAYDAKDQLVSITDPGGYTTTYAYDAVGNRTSATDGNSHTTTYSYDAADRMANQTNALTQTTTYAYDANGNTTGVTDPLSHTTSFSYDALNRRTTVSDPLGNTTTTTYDAVGNVMTATDANGKVSSYTYDSADRLTAVTDALSGNVSYAYDANGNRTGMTDANGHTTAYAYDALGRLTSVTDPLSNVTSHTYDANGNRISTTDANGDTTTYTYDALDRLTGIGYADSSTVAYTYDANGNRLNMVDSTGTTSYTYDSLNRPLSVNQPSGAISYSYDALNRLSITTPAGSVTYTYNGVDQLLTLTDWDANATTYSYDTAGRQTGISYANGITASHTFDNADRLLGITYADGAGTIASFTYTLDAVGNRLTMVDSDGTTTYTYDALNRLTGVGYPSGTPSVVSYTYDPMGNRLTKGQDGVTTSYTYDDSDRLLTTNTGGSITNYTWDDNGNLLTRDGETFSWDKAGRLAGWTEGSETASYEYNGDGVRVERTVNGTATTYLQDLAGGLPVVLRDTTSGTSTDYVYGVDLITTIDSGGAPTFYHGDGLGSTRLLTDSSGNITDQYTYDAFGSERTHTGGSDNPFTYTGEQADPDNGLIFLRMRYYDPDVGRYISADRWRGQDNLPQTTNRYVYVINNPINHTDPTGAIIEKLRDMGSNISYNMAHAGEYVANMKQALADPIARGFVLDEISTNAKIVGFPVMAAGCGVGFAPACYAGGAVLKASKAVDLVNLIYTGSGLVMGEVPESIAVERAIKKGVGLIAGRTITGISGEIGERIWESGTRAFGTEVGGFLGQLTSYSTYGSLKWLYTILGVSGEISQPLTASYLKFINQIEHWGHTGALPNDVNLPVGLGAPPGVSK